MTAFDPLTLIALALPLAAALSWLAAQLHRILPLVPRCNEDMVLTERPFAPCASQPNAAPGARGAAPRLPDRASAALGASAS